MRIVTSHMTAAKSLLFVALCGLSLVAGCIARQASSNRNPTAAASATTPYRGGVLAAWFDEKERALINLIGDKGIVCYSIGTLGQVGDNYQSIQIVSTADPSEIVIGSPPPSEIGERCVSDIAAPTMKRVLESPQHYSLFVDFLGNQELLAPLSAVDPTGQGSPAA